MKIVQHPSPIFNERANNLKPEMIVLHYTGGLNTQYSLDKLSDPKSKVSCHYFIDEKGTIYQMVDEKWRAFHAGIAMWDGKYHINSRSIGIELSNRWTNPKTKKHHPYTKKQLAALTELCHDVMRRYGIPPQNIVGHSDIAPHRKKDPGEHFPWETMARRGIGIWPEPTLKDYFNKTNPTKNAAYVANKASEVRTLLQHAGYQTFTFKRGKKFRVQQVLSFIKDKNISLKRVKAALRNKRATYGQLVTAFQRHFEPELFTQAPEQVGTPSADTVAKLRAYIRQKNQNPSIT